MIKEEVFISGVLLIVNTLFLIAAAIMNVNIIILVILVIWTTQLIRFNSFSEDDDDSTEA